MSIIFKFASLLFSLRIYFRRVFTNIQSSFPFPETRRRKEKERKKEKRISLTNNVRNESSRISGFANPIAGGSNANPNPSDT